MTRMSLACQQGDHADCWADDCYCPICGCQERNEVSGTGSSFYPFGVGCSIGKMSCAACGFSVDLGDENAEALRRMNEFYGHSCRSTDDLSPLLDASIDAARHAADVCEAGK